MSSTTTPTRNGRGMPVPGIDTNIQDKNLLTPPGGIDTNIQDKHSFVYHRTAPLTPPQSAISNESRRPSLAYSSLSEAHSGPSSVCGYSQPATPMSPMHGQDFRQGWSDDHDVQIIQNGMQDVWSQGQMAPPMFSASFSQQPTHAYSTTDAFGIQNTSPQWYGQQQPSSCQPGLQTTLFQTSQSLGHDSISTASMYANPGSSIPPSLEVSPFASYDTSSAQSSSMYQPTQVVMPSQVAPHEDYPMDDYPGYNSHEEISDAYNDSFESSASGYGAWEIVGPNSPNDAYFGQSDEDDFVNVKDEVQISPTRRSTVHNYSHHLSSRPRRRTSRRTRKAHPEGKAWYESESHGIRMRCEGKRFQVIPNSSSSSDTDSFSLTVVPEDSRDTKPHKCHHKDPSGTECGRSFERSEHLKRHQGMHSNARPYPCPVPKCGGRFGRPDNAGDHFKTHLKGPRKGKRNADCTFEVLERGILASYEEKAAAKLLTNLRKWNVAEEARKRAEEERARMLAEEERRVQAYGVRSML